MAIQYRKVDFWYRDFICLYVDRRQGYAEISLY